MIEWDWAKLLEICGERALMGLFGGMEHQTS